MLSRSLSLRSCLHVSLIPGLPSALTLLTVWCFPKAPGSRRSSLPCLLPSSAAGTFRNRLLFIQKLNRKGLCGPSPVTWFPRWADVVGAHVLSRGRAEHPPPAGVEVPGWESTEVRESSPGGDSPLRSPQRPGRSRYCQSQLQGWDSGKSLVQGNNVPGNDGGRVTSSPTSL